MAKTTTFREVINTYYDYRRNNLDSKDFEHTLSDFLDTVISASNIPYLKSLNMHQRSSVWERIATVIDLLPGAFPYADDNYYAKQINKIENQNIADGYSYLWRDSNKILLGSFFPYGINGPRKDMSTSIYLDSTNNNVLVDVKTMTKGQERVSRFCFPDCYDVYTKRPNESYFMQSPRDTIDNIIFTDRFDPFHFNNTDDHTNRFPKNSTAEGLALFQKYFQSTAKTPHLHFYYESVCNGDVIPNADGHAPRGNDRSLAINLGNLSLYINDIASALSTYDSAKPLPEILSNDLGMPYLAIMYGSTAFNSTHFINKVKRLPNIDEKTKSDILKKLNSASMLRLSLQFFGEKYSFLPDSPKDPDKRAFAIKQYKKLAIAYQFINDNAEKLTAGEQRSLLSAIDEGLSRHIDAKDILKQIPKENEYEDNTHNEDDLEPIL